MADVGRHRSEQATGQADHHWCHANQQEGGQEAQPKWQGGEDSRPAGPTLSRPCTVRPAFGGQPGHRSGGRRAGAAGPFQAPAELSGALMGGDPRPAGCRITPETQFGSGSSQQLPDRPRH